MCVRFDESSWKNICQPCNPGGPVLGIRCLRSSDHCLIATGQEFGYQIYMYRKQCLSVYNTMYFFCVKYWMIWTSWKLNKIAAILFLDHLESELFNNQATLDHPNTEHIWFPSPHFNWKSKPFENRTCLVFRSPLFTNSNSNNFVPEPTVRDHPLSPRIVPKSGRNVFPVLNTTSLPEEMTSLLPLPPEIGEEKMTLKWQNGLISNFDYLLYLNSAADR